MLSTPTAQPVDTPEDGRPSFGGQAVDAANHQTNEETVQEGQTKPERESIEEALMSTIAGEPGVPDGISPADLDQARRVVVPADHSHELLLAGREVRRDARQKDSESFTPPAPALTVEQQAAIAHLESLGERGQVTLPEMPDLADLIKPNDDLTETVIDAIEQRSQFTGTTGHFGAL